MGGLECSGLESSLLECNRNDRRISQCTLNEVVAVECEGIIIMSVNLNYLYILWKPEYRLIINIFFIELCNNGDIRITGGPSPLVGRVEVCVNKTWGTVCGEPWSDDHASVVCRQLGHSVYGMYINDLLSGLK